MHYYYCSLYIVVHTRFRVVCLDSILPNDSRPKAPQEICSQCCHILLFNLMQQLHRDRLVPTRGDLMSLSDIVLCLYK